MPVLYCLGYVDRLRCNMPVLYRLGGSGFNMPVLLYLYWPPPLKPLPFLPRH